MSPTGCPPHLLLLDEPLGHELVDRRFHKTCRYSFPKPMALPVVDDTRSIVVDIGLALGAPFIDEELHTRLVKLVRCARCGKRRE